LPVYANRPLATENLLKIFYWVFVVWPRAKAILFSPGGYRSTAGSYNNLSNNANWWSSTESGANAWNRNLNYNNSSVNRNYNNKAYGFSVRCVRESILARGTVFFNGITVLCRAMKSMTGISKNQKLSLYLQLYQFLKFLYKMTRNFPKQYKYTLGQNVLDLTWRCIDSVLEANVSSNSEKYQKILRLSVAFDQLKIRLRMAQEINLISKKQFSHIQTYYIREIGEMVGGWLRWAALRSRG